MIQLEHEVSLADGNAHLLQIRTTVRGDGALPSPLVVFMPVWTPGSYLVREYARHVESMAATAGGRALHLQKIRKNAWRIEPDGAPEIRIEYQLYANDLTVRTNYADGAHAYWNGAATYLAVEQEKNAGARVVVAMPEGWQIATPLEQDSSDPRATTFVARTFDELCDSPFECGALIERSFTALGQPHRLAAPKSDDALEIDWDKLAADTRTIVFATAKLIAGTKPPELALPYDRYLFLWHISPRGFGGLEHRTSATLMAKPSSFLTRSGYLEVLSLVAHEFFHVWNVKRIRPEGLVPYRYEEENYTRLLWWFEGATSYYDWRALRLANLCTAAEYLGHLGERVLKLVDTPGSLAHSLEEASFDAWIKAYRPDENSLNSTVSYYLKGEVVCALLDLTLRHRTQGRATLDDVLRYLYWEFGARDRAVPEGALAGIFAEVSGVSVDDCFENWVRGARAIDVNAVLAHAGLVFERTAKRDSAPVSLGLRLTLAAGRAIVEAVPRGSPAHRAGIDPKDEIVAIAGRRMPEGRLELPLWGLTPGSTVPVLLAREGRMRTVELCLDGPPLTEGKITPRADASPDARRLYEAWMGDVFPA